MANISNLNQLKQKYRTRYYRNRVQDIPDLKPGDNAMTFVANYLNVTASNSDREDSIVLRRSPSPHVAHHSRNQPSKEKEAKDSPTKSRVNDTPQYAQGNAHLMTNCDPPAIPATLKNNEKQSNISDDKLFSEEESDNEDTYEVAKLIEESLAEGDYVVDNELMNNSGKPREKLYSPNTSVLQEPPCPTSSIHAKKWLSFKDSTFAANDNVLTDVVSRTSEDFTNNGQQLKQQEARNSTKNPDGADDLHTESTNNGPKDGYVIKEESGYNTHASVSPLKASPLSSRPKEDKPTTPKTTNSFEASSSLKRKSENVKASLNSSATGERLGDEEKSSCNWISPFGKKSASPLSTRSNEDKPGATPKETNSFEASSCLKRQSETVKASLNSSATAERLDDQFVIEEDSSSYIWISSFKKKMASPLSTRPKEDQPTTPRKTNSFEASSSLKRKSEDVKASLNSSTTATRLSAVSHAPAPSTSVCNNEEEFEIEDISHMNKANLLTNIVKTKSIQTRCVRKREKSALQLLKNAKDDEDFESDGTVMKVNRKQDYTSFKKDMKIAVQIDPVKTVNLESNNAAIQSDAEANAYLPQESTLPRVVEGIEQQGPLSQDAALQRVVESVEKPVAASHDDLPQVVEEGIESEERVYQDVLPVESQEENYSHHTENVSLNRIKQVQQIRCSPRLKSDGSPGKYLHKIFSIKIKKGKDDAKSKAPAKSTKKSKVSEEKQEERKSSKIHKSNKQGKSSKARNESESAKDCMSNDPEEILENSTTKLASRKRTHTDEVVKADMKKNVGATVFRQPDNEGLEFDNVDEQHTVTDAGLQSKKRKAKMKNISTPCPADHDKEYSVFQSGPVKRQRAVQLLESVKPLALDCLVIESSDEEHDSGEDDELIVSSGENMVAADCIGGPKTDAHISEEQEELLKRYSIVFDPDTRSDALVECIAQSEKSKFVGSNYCTYWNSFNNNIFTTGKLKIAPKKKNETHTFVSKIVIYYVEQGLVQVNLHKSERILKNGDFFFVPPGNSCTIANLQDKEAVVVFNVLKMQEG